MTPNTFFYNSFVLFCFYKRNPVNISLHAAIETVLKFMFRVCRNCEVTKKRTFQNGEIKVT